MGRIRWPLGGRDGARVVAAPGSGAGEAADRERQGRRGGKRRPARHAGRDRRHGGRRQRLRRGGGRRGRARRGRALQLRHRRRRVHGPPRRRQRPDHDDRQPREGAGGDEARQLLHRRQAADGRAVPAQPLQRADRRRPRHARGVGVRAQALRHDSTSARRSATACRSRTNGFVVDKTFYDQTTGNQTYFDDIPSTATIYLDPDGTATDVGRMHQEPGHGAHVPAASAGWARPRASTAARSPTRSSRPSQQVPGRRTATSTRGSRA